MTKGQTRYQTEADGPPNQSPLNTVFARRKWLIFGEIGAFLSFLDGEKIIFSPVRLPATRLRFRAESRRKYLIPRLSAPIRALFKKNPLMRIRKTFPSENPQPGRRLLKPQIFTNETQMGTDEGGFLLNKTVCLGCRQRRTNTLGKVMSYA
jgi:hypothetical protein